MSSGSTVPPSPPKTPTPVFREYNFELSPVPPNPLLGGRCIKTAAALIIGDEILNGKTLDRNSNYFARWCFEWGVELKRIEVIADDEAEIAEAAKRLVQNHDLVITSGGIGPTHDDITYASLAKAFGQDLAYHDETLRRMDETSKHRRWVSQQSEEQKTARRRMALFPANAEVLFVSSDIFVPVVRLAGKLHVFPGIPSLFQKMLDNLPQFLPLPPPEERPYRVQVFTPLPESTIAPILTSLHASLSSPSPSSQSQSQQHAPIRIGSYPVLQSGVYISLIGSHQDRMVLERVAKELIDTLNAQWRAQGRDQCTWREEKDGANANANANVSGSGRAGDNQKAREEAQGGARLVSREEMEAKRLESERKSNL
ncbi:Molybdopterin binding protein [Coniophora puteana RWD-64-598 SS2]|uniref:Molybdopterin binding protein n=1 Tax=Coniophora puteana (strain RWD-64-598) TaxID=741705 RepID=A0A5M3ML75_CONPW|nr:Molybdopterin binding protein [Coniophora puteana RWD-64-598 SS2]EIW79710.1 Molybdopterin binding protein [Coniophora puteana RWD-64-598 SS2]